MALEHSNNSLLIGCQHIRLKTVNSTNKYAVDIISKSKPIEGTVISASFQNDGRGQIGRCWESEKDKNIICSIILLPKYLLAQDQFQLSMAISLAVFDFVDHFLPCKTNVVKIKWPNDIYVNDEKIAGILIQNTIKGKYINTSIAGIGINMNQKDFSENIPNPTSIGRLLDANVGLEVAYQWLFRFLTKRYLQLSAGRGEQLRNEYLDNLYRNDLWCDFKEINGTLFKGKISGIDDIGQLNIKTKSGFVRSFAFRDVKFVI